MDRSQGSKPFSLILALSLSVLACASIPQVIDRLVDQIEDGSLVGDVTTSEDTSQQDLPLDDSEQSHEPALGEGAPQFESDILEQMEEIEAQVITLRGLQPTSEVVRGILTREELSEQVEDDFFEDYTAEDAANDQLTLALFGFIDPDYDLLALYTQLYSEQIAGYYDDELKQMFVVREIGFGGPERLTYAHEYAHALQDQNYDLQDGLGYNDDACEEDSERCAAIQALVEGDATLIEEQWLRTYATDQDWDDLFEFSDNYSSPVFDSAPRVIQEGFLYPYTAGREFVQQLYLDGGWAAVDDAYKELPLSTEQILHYERYPHDVPIKLEVPDLAPTLGTDWERTDEDVLGELYTRYMLEEHISLDEAADAAEGWGGDYYLIFYNQEQSQSALVMVTQWDTIRDAHEFYEAFRAYGDHRFGEHIRFTTTMGLWEGEFGFSSVEVRGDQTLWILTSDAIIGGSLLEVVPFPAEALNP